MYGIFLAVGVLVATTAAESSAAAAPCAVHGTHACSLNGECTSDGLCKCDKGWKGESCGILDLSPQPTIAYGYGGSTPNTSSWGGGPPVFDGAKWHLYVSEIAGNCGMGTWSRMSQAVHAVSDAMDGPYTRVELAIPTQTHNTYYAYSAPDKLHLLYSIFGGTNPESCNPYKNCTDGTTPGHAGGVHPDRWLPAPSCPIEHSTFVHYSRSLGGPWVSAGPLQVDRVGCPSCGDSNPAPYIFPNGTVIMLARTKDSANKRHNIYLYRARSWNSTYTWVPGAGPNGTVAGIGNGLLFTEDPVLYKGRRGFHALFHSHPDLTHGWSEDALTWHWSAELIGPALQAGGDNERPRVAVDADGDLAALFVGQLVVANHDGSRTAAFVPNPQNHSPAAGPLR